METYLISYYKFIPFPLFKLMLCFPAVNIDRLDHFYVSSFDNWFLLIIKMTLKKKIKVVINMAFQVEIKCDAYLYLY